MFLSRFLGRNTRTMSSDNTRNALLNAMEAVALTLAVTLPITVSPFAEAYFEVPKALFLRIMALGQLFLLTGWWLCSWSLNRSRAVNHAPGQAKSRWLNLTLATAVFAVVSLLSALLALNPGYAFVGCPQRGGGALTTVAGVILFTAASVYIRRREQIERLLAVLVIGTLPCLVFVLCEYAGAHPLGLEGGGPIWRASGSFGNANFLGSFCAVFVPLALGSAWLSWSRRRIVTAATFSICSLLLLTGLVLSGSRGPLLALLAGGGVATLLLLAASGYRQWARRLAKTGIVVVTLALLAFYAYFVVPIRSGWTATGTEHGLLRTGTVAVRLHIYRTIADRMLSAEPIRSTFGTPDPLSKLRFWIGYGPQNLMVASERYFSSTLEHLENDFVGIDTAHCLLLEIWAESGVLGLLAWCAVFLIAVVAVVRALCLAADQKTLWQVCGMIASGAMLVAVLLALFWGAWAWGFGFAVGTIIGVLYAVQWLCAKDLVPKRIDIPALVTATALLVFLFDAQMGVLTVSVATVAWLLLGAMQALPKMASPTTTTDASPVVPQTPAALTPGLIVAVTLACAVATDAGLYQNKNLTYSLGHMLRDIFSSSMGLPGLVTLAVGVVLIAEATAWRRNRLLPIVVLVGTWLVTVVIRCTLLAHAFGQPLASDTEALAFGTTLSRYEIVRYIYVAASSGLAAAVLVNDWKKRRGWLIPALLCVMGLVTATAVLFAWPRSGAAVQGRLAAAYFFEGTQRPDLAVTLLRQTIGKSVWDDVHYARLHRIYGTSTRALTSVAPQAANKLFNQSEHMLAKSRLAAPYDPQRLVYLGKFYQILASQNQPGSEPRTRFAHQSVDVFRQASELAPGRQSTRIALVMSLLDLLNDKPAAERELVSILDDDPQHARANELLAYLCQRHGRQAGADSDMQAAWLKKADEFAKRALASPWRDRDKVDVPRLTTIVNKTKK